MLVRRFSTNTLGIPSTLVLHGIEWGYFTHQGQLALGWKNIAIHWEPVHKTYVIKVRGEIKFESETMSKCLDWIPELMEEIRG